MTKETLNKKIKRNGFTVLVAVIVSALVLSIGLSIANITVKQITLSSAGRDSQIAFYVADSAAECALYNDLIHPNHPDNSPFPDPDNPAFGVVDCFGQSVAVSNEGFSTDVDGNDYALSKIVFSSPGHWSEVTIRKTKVPSGSDYVIKTIISALGYNANPALPNKRLIERGLEITY